MRKQASNDGLVVLAVAGTYVVTLGWDLLDDKVKDGLLGFAILRTDHTENETYWLRGTKTFPDTSPPLAIGGDASSHDQPYQTFQWADYSAKPAHSYSYKLIAMVGAPGALKDGATVTVDVNTETEWASASNGPHSVFFNRAAIASQEYARRFQNKQPDEVGAPAFEWLSRGLLEALLAFIARAEGHGFGLRVAIYEFQLAGILDALRDASARGVDVAVVYDAIQNAAEQPVNANEEAIAQAEIARFCFGLTNGKIMHNKFMVLTKGDAPVAVWTGSTNFTESAVYGQLNVGHAVDDAKVAQIYLDFWNELRSDPELGAMRGWNGAKTPPPEAPPPQGVTEEFSPQVGTETLTRFADIAGGATSGLFMTFAFGMNKVFEPVYARKDDVLRFALMDKAGVGKAASGAREKIDALRKQPNVVIAVGQNIVANEFDRWLKEVSGLAESVHVRWVHTKLMLVDPLSDDPVVITGSANFSAASVESNHENMLLIRGDARVADIYLGEFMRQFTSYAFRDAAYAYEKQTGQSAASWRPQDLVPDNSWLKTYFEDGSSRALRRLYFAGRAAAETPPEPAPKPTPRRRRRASDESEAADVHPTRGKAHPGGRKRR